MTLQTGTKLASASPASVLPPAVLEKLAARLRPTGACLVLMRPDGSLAYADPVAGAFFTKFAVPLVQHSHVLAEKIRRLTAGTPVVAFDSLAGVLLAAAPFAQRKQVHAIPGLLARPANFRLSEDVLQACFRLSLDAQWLEHQAESLAPYTRETLTRQAALLSGMLQDQLKLAGVEAELNSLSEQLANSYEELSLIYQISGGMRVNRRASEFFKQACNDVLEVLNVRGVGVVVQGDGPSRVDPVVYGSITIPDDLLRKLAEQLLAGIQGRKGLLLSNDLAADGNFSWLSHVATRLLAVPLLRQDKILGCMFALDKQSSDFDSVDSKLLHSIANESAIYIENSMLFADVHGLMMGLLHSLTSAVDAKDAYTCGHSERVALLSRHLAQQLNLPDQEVEQVYLAALLHDLGKIGVPEVVLQKTGRLTAEEFEQMKKHPQIGARILADVKQVRPLIPGVLHHHERYDGKGYPSGLSGTNIPMMGRIICLADCFDAMTSNRTYRKGLPLEVALAEIRRCAGTQFDPAMAEIFLRTGADRFRELLRNHAEKSKQLLELQETLRTA
jgi:HD-GYP domain-containing protein (c-di-GMP phosphodiesterase class II)